MLKKNKITVIGAANVDITATPLGAYMPCDSNPSQVEIAFGGVGRNIAHNLCLLGMDVSFFTVFGDDRIALSLRDDCRRLGMTIDPILEIAGARSNYFICVNDHHGEMQAGAADMELMSHLTSAMVEAQLDSINASDAVVVDCNLSEDVLRFIANHCTVPLYVDATSAAKAIKIKSMLDVIHKSALIIKVNRAEAIALSGIGDNVEEIAQWFIAHGADRIYITMGADGVYSHDGSTGTEIPSQAVHVVNATGAGDAFMAGGVYAEMQGATASQACETGIKAAAFALQVKTAVNQDINKLIDN